ncbi:MAG: hypothetical protein AVDCRST_MAG50-629 [uncultured Acidimicrobiales bacterium]|uniref:Gram-positive cocci surface proteins LPxTG domain-containing protein n=1 Tax=uncultured Acidimicrobiales bacterium TaxID=310071 RepID=A0A6J4HGS2_9ACTN|nr:MAG: hypothetical protein AVDCRST_MAG50-629 [uncultured Acidimicrobiales bacterium]
MKHRIVGALVISAAVLFPSAAYAQTTGGYGNPNTPPNVGGEVTVRDTPTSPGTNVQGTQTTRANQTLPVTGGDMVGLGAMGVGLVGVGTLLARRNRTRAIVTQ